MIELVWAPGLAHIFFSHFWIFLLISLKNTHFGLILLIYFEKQKNLAQLSREAHEPKGKANHKIWTRTEPARSSATSSLASTS